MTEYDAAPNETRITSFCLTYTKQNDSPAVQDLPNVNLKVTLNCLTAKDFFFLDSTPASDGGTAQSQYIIKNHVDFEAKSVFYQEAQTPDEDNYHRSDDEVSVGGTTPDHGLTKMAHDTSTGLDALADHGTRNDNISTIVAGETFYYRIRYVNNMQFYETLYVSDLLEYVVGGEQRLDPDSFKIARIQVHYDDGMIEYDGRDYGGSVTWDGIVNTGEQYAAYKEFRNVAVGAVIVIVWEVTADTDITIGGNVKNDARISTTINQDTCIPESYLKEGTANITVTPAAEKMQVQKIFLDADGHADGTDYYFNVGDPVEYQVTISNSSTVDVTTTFDDTWPGDGVRLTGISGVPAGLTIELYSSADAPGPYKTYLSDGTPIADLTDSPMLIRIRNLVVPADGSVTIVTKGVVTGEGAYTNTAAIDGKPGTGLRFSTKHLSLSTEKVPYLIEPNAGGMDWNGASRAHTGYYEGSMVRFEICVTNNSLTGDEIDHVLTMDTYDSLYEAAGSYPRAGTYGGKTGTVIVEYADGTFEALDEISWQTMEKARYGEDTKGYHKMTPEEAAASGVQQNVMFFAVNDANLPAGATMKFHVFFEMTAPLLDQYFNPGAGAQSPPWLGNHVRVYTWDSANPAETYIEASYWTYIVPLEEGHTSTVEVTKSPLAIYAGIYTGLATSGGTSGYKDARVTPPSAAKDFYLVYQVRIDNTSNFGDADIAVYRLIDTLPAGTTYIGITAPNLVEAYHIYGLNKLGSGGQMVTAECYGTEGESWNDNFHAGIQYDDATRRLEIDFTYNPTLRSGVGAAFAIVVKVTENREMYDNVAGYVVDGDIDTNGRSTPADDGKKYIYDNAAFSGPVYHAGIEKTAAQYMYGGSWYDLGGGDYIVIQPSYQIRWQLTLTNGPLSTTALTNYQVVDILPKEFRYVAGTATLGGATLGDPDIVTLADGRKRLTWGIPGPLAVGASTVLAFVSEWDTTVTQTRGLYQNQAALVLSNYNLQGSVHGELDKAEHTVTDYAQVNMLGASGTTSYKTVENVTPTSPFYEEVAQGIKTTQSIHAIAGDTVRYALRVTSKSNALLKNVVLIDSLPRVGDTGVVNRSIARNTKFSVDFADIPNVAVRIVRADATVVEVPVSQFSVHFTTVGSGGLSAEDWAGTSSWAGSAAQSDSIRVVLDDSLNIAFDDTVVVTFDAVVAGETGQSVVLPTSEDYAWNSFGYAYHTADDATRLYAEPIKVGVNIPYATIRVTKSVVDEKSGSEIDDETPFTFLLSRKTADDGWEPAEGVRYQVDDTVYALGADGRFTVNGGQSITLCVPAAEFYRLQEVEIAEGYALRSINADSGLVAFETGKLAQGANAAVTFVNTRRQDRWTVMLLKKSCYDELLEGVTFTLLKQGDGGVFAVYGAYENVPTDENGVILLRDLPAGVYKLVEVDTPDKYNLADDTIFTIPYSPGGAEDVIPDGVTIVATTEGGADFLLTVINYTRAKLPETGGAGVWPAHLLGALLMSAAALPGAVTRMKKKRRAP